MEEIPLPADSLALLLNSGGLLDLPLFRDLPEGDPAFTFKTVPELLRPSRTLFSGGLGRAATKRGRGIAAGEGLAGRMKTRSGTALTEVTALRRSKRKAKNTRA